MLSVAPSERNLSSLRKTQPLGRVPAAHGDLEIPRTAEQRTHRTARRVRISGHDWYDPAGTGDHVGRSLTRETLIESTVEIADQVAKAIDTQDLAGNTFRFRDRRR